MLKVVLYKNKECMGCPITMTNIEYKKEKEFFNLHGFKLRIISDYVYNQLRNCDIPRNEKGKKIKLVKYDIEKGREKYFKLKKGEKSNRGLMNF